MGFWPFGGGKRQRVVESDDHGREGLLRRAPSDSMAQQEKTAGEQSSLGRRGSNNNNNRRKEGPRRLSKIRAQGSEDVIHTQPSRSQTAPVASKVDLRGTSQRSSQYNEKSLYRQNPVSQSSIGPEIFTVTQAPPTLRAKRAETDTQLPRRKSSKRKAEDYAREREIKAMSSSSPIPIPKRPNSFYGSGPFQRDSRQVPGPLNRRLERPTSEISLPVPGSLPDVDDMSNQNSFKIGMFAALSPRPTVRYDANPRLSASKQPARSNIAIRQAIEEEDISDKKRIDELADDLDAGGLRELMERDRRRRERKKEADKAKLQRRLQRRAERQREEEARRARTEAFVRASPTSPPRNQGAVNVPSAHQATTSQSRPSVEQPSGGNPFEDPGPATLRTHEAIRNPFEDEKDMDIMQGSHDSEDNIEEAIPVPVRSPMRKVSPKDVKPKHKPLQSTISPPVSPVNKAVDRSSMSQGSLLNRELTPDITESASLERRTSEQSSQRLGSWTSFFRRGTRTKFTGPSHGRTTPSEFSNTSRESFSRKQPPVTTPRTFRRSNSGTPQRTLSRFREDLPELPISPPDSRVQSPEASVLPRSSSQRGHSKEASTSSMNVLLTGNTPAVQIVGSVGRHYPKRSDDFDVPNSNAPDIALSRSLASVDSEGSWLSGKPPKRLSGQLSHAVKPSQSSLQPHIPGAFEQLEDEDDDDDDLMDDEYYNRLSPTPLDRRPSTERRASSTIIDLQNEQEQTSIPDLPASPKFVDEKWHQGVGRQPTLIQQAGRAKSKEGLLKEYSADAPRHSSSSENGEEQDPESPIVVTAESSVMRARSVDYKKGHARHMSAGSAKLLDIRRASMHSDTSYPRTPTNIPRKSDLALHIEHPVPDADEPPQRESSDLNR